MKRRTSFLFFSYNTFCTVDRFNNIKPFEYVTHVYIRMGTSPLIFRVIIQTNVRALSLLSQDQQDSLRKKKMNSKKKRGNWFWGGRAYLEGWPPFSKGRGDIRGTCTYESKPHSSPCSSSLWTNLVTLICRLYIVHC